MLQKEGPPPPGFIEQILYKYYYSLSIVQYSTKVSALTDFDLVFFQLQIVCRKAVY